MEERITASLLKRRTSALIKCVTLFRLYGLKQESGEGRSSRFGMRDEL